VWGPCTLRKGERVVALGLNPLELLANPSKTEWRVQVGQNEHGNDSVFFTDGSYTKGTVRQSR